MPTPTSSQEAQNQRLLETQRRLEQGESKLQPVTQQQINTLYREIRDYMVQAKEAATREGKQALFVIGEAHTIILGKTSLVVEAIFLHIAKQLGISHLYMEGDGSILNDAREVAQMLENDRLVNPRFYQQAVVGTRVNANLLSRNSLIKDLQIVPAEQSVSEDYADSVRRRAERETAMCRTVVNSNRPGVLRVGMEHLKGIAEHPLLKRNFRVFPVNTVRGIYINQFVSEEQRRDNYPLYMYAVTSNNVKQFLINATLATVTPAALLDMVDNAHQNFLTVQQRNSRSAVRRQAKSQRQPASKTAAADNPLPPPPTPSGDAMLLAAQRPNSRPAMLERNVPLLADSQHAQATQTSTHPAQTTRALQPAVISWHPLEKVPVTTLVEIGFWAASKLGFCANPLRSVVPVTFSNAVVTQLSEARMQAASADLTLQQKGSSLEASARELFGNHYRMASHGRKEQLKLFLSRVVNGDVPRGIGEQFNKIVAKNTNRQYRRRLRGGELISLMESEARSSLITDKDVEQQWPVHRRV
jgi:hypothetical protein